MVHSRNRKAKWRFTQRSGGVRDASAEPEGGGVSCKKIGRPDRKVSADRRYARESRFDHLRGGARFRAAHRAQAGFFSAPANFRCVPWPGIVVCGRMAAYEP